MVRSHGESITIKSAESIWEVGECGELAAGGGRLGGGLGSGRCCRVESSREERDRHGWMDGRADAQRPGWT
jgi:hypothetical protein